VNRQHAHREEEEDPDELIRSAFRDPWTWIAAALIVLLAWITLVILPGPL
jgi:hypothetical protein